MSTRKLGKIEQGAIAGLSTVILGFLILGMTVDGRRKEFFFGVIILIVIIFAIVIVNDVRARGSKVVSQSTSVALCN